MTLPNAKQRKAIEKLSHAWNYVANQKDFGTGMNQLARDIFAEAERHVRCGFKSSLNSMVQDSYVALYHDRF